MRKTKIPNELSHSGMEIKVCSKDWVKLLYHLTIPFQMFSCRFFRFNLLSVSQLCKMGYNCLFTDVGVTVFRRSDDSIAFKGVLEDQLYLVDFNRAKLDTCLIAKTNMGWLWHRRLAHVGMKNLHKLLKGEHILGLTRKTGFVAHVKQGSKLVFIIHTRTSRRLTGHSSYSTWTYSAR